MIFVDLIKVISSLDPHSRTSHMSHKRVIQTSLLTVDLQSRRRNLIPTGFSKTHLLMQSPFDTTATHQLCRLGL